MSWHLIGFINSSLFKRTMNKKYALPAIAMVAVVMGMSAFAPAMAQPPNLGSEATIGVCHQYSDGSWAVLYTSNAGQINGHTNGHGDNKVNNSTEAGFCVGNQDGSVTDWEEYFLLTFFIFFQFSSFPKNNFKLTLAQNVKIYPNFKRI